jgi:hypothetical protein
MGAVEIDAGRSRDRLRKEQYFERQQAPAVEAKQHALKVGRGRNNAGPLQRLRCWWQRL